MPNARDIEWFKDTFGAEIAAAAAGTPFDLDMVTAIACQETGHIWQRLRKEPNPLSRDEILALCVGDTIDAKPNGGGRRAFPKNKAELLAHPKGDQMFAIARKALEDMAPHVPGFAGALANRSKFCRGYGLFQFDLQFFKNEPEYFLQRRYEKLEHTLEKCLHELKNAKGRIPSLKHKPQLSDEEFAFVAIAYNTGRFIPARGLMQGFRGPDGRFYGQNIFDFVRLSRTVAAEGDTPQLAPPAPGRAIMAQPTGVAATGPFMVVDTLTSTLRVRSEPRISAPPTRNVIGELPDGHPVRAVTDTKKNGFFEIETSLSGAHLRGFCSAQFLKPAPAARDIPVETPALQPPASGIVAVHMPHRPNVVTKRTGIATAHSLNEAGQPGRRGTTAEGLRDELAAIVDWLAVDRAAHKRYQPRREATFCNIYAHDFCHLAGIYLPRVWWTETALEKLVQGQQVAPLIGNTIREMRANDLFRWLRDFGLRFGWRQTGTLDKLQQAANQGDVGVIVARRTQEGRSGHIVIVPPETGQHHAERRQGAVIKPLQSQAGTANFRYGTSTLNWWKGAQFAESAFWIHD
jgi:hypothetical protein